MPVHHSLTISIQWIPSVSGKGFSLWVFAAAPVGKLARRSLHTFVASMSFGMKKGGNGTAKSSEPTQFTGEKIQSNGRIRSSLVFETFPCQPHLGFSQAISSCPKIFIASFSESAGLEHFRCKLILCPSLGHANTIL